MPSTPPLRPANHAPSDSYCRAAWDAICRSQAVIEFDARGVIMWANGRFLSLMGYSLAELVGQHHRMLCDPEYAASAEYARFWDMLRDGEFDQGEFSRRRADGSEIWMQASYNPIFDQERVIQRVLKVAADVTRQVLLERASSKPGSDAAHYGRAWGYCNRYQRNCRPDEPFSAQCNNWGGASW